jgi:hypothetical protein
VTRALLALAAAMSAMALAAPPARSQEMLGFRIRSWVDWDDQRIVGGQAFVAGPYGLGFVLKARFEASEFEIQIRPRVTADSTRYYAFVETRQPARTDDSGRGLFSFDAYNRLVVVGRTQAAMLVLPLQPESGESATLNVLIDGPFARAFEGRSAWTEQDAVEPRGVRYSVPRAYPRLEVAPIVIPGSVALRVSLDGSSEAVRVLAGPIGSSEFTIPGLHSRWVAHRHPSPPPPAALQQCFDLFRAPPPVLRGSFAPDDRAQWCVPDSERWGVVSVTSANGVRFRMQEIP